MSDLKAKHWEKYGSDAEFQVKHKAANDAPPMGILGFTFPPNSVRLVQEAYNIIIGEYDLTHWPMCPEKGYFDYETSRCIEKFQAHYKLKVTGTANKETLTKMDELLVQVETDKLKPTFKILWA